MTSDLRDLVQECEQEALAYFGPDQIGTRELRLGLNWASQQYLIQWLMRLYNQKYVELTNK